jgi:hypothetical protein
MSLVPAAPSNELAAFDPFTARVGLREELELWQSCFEFAKAIALTPFIPADIRGKPDAVMATIIRGHELGISAFESLQKIDFIKGRTAMRSELMRALIQRAGHTIRVEESSNTRVTLVGQRAGEDHATKVTWTQDDVVKAGLQNNENHKKYPRAMLLARATGELARMVFADVLAGMSYATEEVEAGWGFGDDDLEAPGELPPAPAAAPTVRAATASAKPRARRQRPKPLTAGVEDVPSPPLPGETVDVTATEPEAPPIPEPDEHAPTGEPEEIVTSRAQQIAMRAQKAGVDHHQVIAAVTNGVKTSAKDIDAAEGSLVLEALVAIAQGKLWVDDSGESPRLVTEQPADVAVAAAPDLSPVGAPAPPAGDGADDDTPSYEWTGDDWRAFLGELGVKVTTLLAEAQRLAKEDGDEAPGSLDDLAGRDALCELLVSFAEDTAAKAGQP